MAGQGQAGINNTSVSLTCVLVLHHLPELGQEGGDVVRYGRHDDLHQRHGERRGLTWSEIVTESTGSTVVCGVINSQVPAVNHGQ